MKAEHFHFSRSFLELPTSTLPVDCTPFSNSHRSNPLYWLRFFIVLTHAYISKEYCLVLPLSELHIIEIVLFFSPWFFILLKIIYYLDSSMMICVALVCSFSLLNSTPAYLDVFKVWLLNNDDLYRFIHVSWCTYAGFHLGYASRSEIAGL